MANRWDKTRKTRKPVQRDRTVTALTEDPNTHLLVPTPQEEPVAVAVAPPLSQPFSLVPSGQVTLEQFAIGTPNYPQTFGYSSFNAQLMNGQFDGQGAPGEAGNVFFHPGQQAPFGLEAAGGQGSQNDLSILENLKQSIKAGQHDFYRAVPNPGALASIYMGPHPSKMNGSQAHPNPSLPQQPHHSIGVSPAVAIDLPSKPVEASGTLRKSESESASAKTDVASGNDIASVPLSKSSSDIGSASSQTIPEFTKPLEASKGAVPPLSPEKPLSRSTSVDTGKVPTLQPRSPTASISSIAVPIKREAEDSVPVPVPAPRAPSEDMSKSDRDTRRTDDAANQGVKGDRPDPSPSESRAESRPGTSAPDPNRQRESEKEAEERKARERAQDQRDWEERERQRLARYAQYERDREARLAAHPDLAAPPRRPPPDERHYEPRYSAPPRIREVEVDRERRPPPAVYDDRRPLLPDDRRPLLPDDRRPLLPDDRRPLILDDRRLPVKDDRVYDRAKDDRVYERARDDRVYERVALPPAARAPPDERRVYPSPSADDRMIVDDPRAYDDRQPLDDSRRALTIDDRDRRILVDDRRSYPPDDRHRRAIDERIVNPPRADPYPSVDERLPAASRAYDERVLTSRPEGDRLRERDERAPPPRAVEDVYPPSSRIPDDRHFRQESEYRRLPEDRRPPPLPLDDLRSQVSEERRPPPSVYEREHRVAPPSVESRNRLDEDRRPLDARLGSPVRRSSTEDRDRRVSVPLTDTRALSREDRRPVDSQAASLDVKAAPRDTATSIPLSINGAALREPSSPVPLRAPATSETRPSTELSSHGSKPMPPMPSERRHPSLSERDPAPATRQASREPNDRALVDSRPRELSASVGDAVRLGPSLSLQERISAAPPSLKDRITDPPAVDSRRDSENYKRPERNSSLLERIGPASDPAVTRQAPPSGSSPQREARPKALAEDFTKPAATDRTIDDHRGRALSAGDIYRPTTPTPSVASITQVRKASSGGYAAPPPPSSSVSRAPSVTRSDARARSPPPAISSTRSDVRSYPPLQDQPVPRPPPEERSYRPDVDKYARDSRTTDLDPQRRYPEISTSSSARPRSPPPASYHSTAPPRTETQPSRDPRYSEPPVRREYVAHDDRERRPAPPPVDDRPPRPAEYERTRQSWDREPARELREPAPRESRYYDERERLQDRAPPAWETREQHERRMASPARTAAFAPDPRDAYREPDRQRYDTAPGALPRTRPRSPSPPSYVSRSRAVTGPTDDMRAPPPKRARDDGYDAGYYMTSATSTTRRESLPSDYPMRDTRDPPPSSSYYSSSSRSVAPPPREHEYTSSAYAADAYDRRPPPEDTYRPRSEAPTLYTRADYERGREDTRYSMPPPRH